MQPSAVPPVAVGWSSVTPISIASSKLREKLASGFRRQAIAAGEAEIFVSKD
jgi:hypothetical protein